MDDVSTTVPVTRKVELDEGNIVHFELERMELEDEGHAWNHLRIEGYQRCDTTFEARLTLSDITRDDLIALSEALRDLAAHTER